MRWLTNTSSVLEPGPTRTAGDADPDAAPEAPDAARAVGQPAADDDES